MRGWEGGRAGGQEKEVSTFTICLLLMRVPKAY